MRVPPRSLFISSSFLLTLLSTSISSLFPLSLSHFVSIRPGSTQSRISCGVSRSIAGKRAGRALFARACGHSTPPLTTLPAEWYVLIRCHNIALTAPSWFLFGFIVFSQPTLFFFFSSFETFLYFTPLKCTTSPVCFLTLRCLACCLTRACVRTALPL